jgi:RNA polymerase-binding transcription factor DksA
VTGPERERYRQELVELGRRIKSDFTGLAGEAFRTGGGETSGSLSNAPLHLADLGTDHFNQELTVSLMEAEGQRLEEIISALKRVEAGTYGTCARCGKEIAHERLQAVPYARHCVECARAVEQSAEAEGDDVA